MKVEKPIIEKLTAGETAEVTQLQQKNLEPLHKKYFQKVQNSHCEVMEIARAQRSRVLGSCPDSISY